MTARRAVLSLCAAAIVAHAFSKANAESGTTALPFLQRSMDAKATGMGGAFVAVPSNLGSIQYNPAALASLARPTVGMTYMPGLGGGDFGYLAYGHPFRSAGTLSAGIQYYNAGPVTLNLSNGTQGTVTAEEDTMGIVSYAIKPGAGLSLGASLKHVRSSLGGAANAAATMADAGVLWETPFSGFSAGAALQNAGTNVKYESSGDPLPRTQRMGVAYNKTAFQVAHLDPSVDRTDIDFTATADEVVVLHEQQSPRVGLEMGLSPFFLSRVAFRFGWTFNRVADTLAIGFGFKEKRYSLDYAFGPGGELASVHQITFSVYFGDENNGNAK